MIYSNSNLKNRFKDYLKTEIASLNKKLVLQVIQIGDELASTKYINIKKRIGSEIGIEVIIHKVPVNIDEIEIKKLLDSVKENNNGLIFQLPVPVNFQSLVLETPKNADVDLLGKKHYKLWNKGFLPPTVGAIDLVIKDILSISQLSNFEQNIDFTGKIVGVIGQGKLVGAPLLRYLQERHATIISINKDTPSPEVLSRQSDILICAAGRPNLVNKNWLKENALVIDAATTESNGALIGDIDTSSLLENNMIVGSPGGIGPITVLYLFYNLLKLGKLSD